MLNEAERERIRLEEIEREAIRAELRKSKWLRRAKTSAWMGLAGIALFTIMVWIAGDPEKRLQEKLIMNSAAMSAYNHATYAIARTPSIIDTPKITDVWEIGDDLWKVSFKGYIRNPDGVHYQRATVKVNLKAQSVTWVP